MCFPPTILHPQQNVCVCLQRSLLPLHLPFGHSKLGLSPWQLHSTSCGLHPERAPTGAHCSPYRKYFGITMCSSDLCWQGAKLSHVSQCLLQATPGTLGQGHFWKIENLSDRYHWFPNGLRLFHLTSLPSFSHSLRSDLYCSDGSLSTLSRSPHKHVL